MGNRNLFARLKAAVAPTLSPPANAGGKLRQGAYSDTMRQGAQRYQPQLKKLKRMALLSLALTVFLGLTMAVTAHASDFTINMSAGEEAGNMGAMEVIFILAFLSLLPSLILMFTSFTRIVIVLSFIRNAMGTGQSPPNMVITGLSLILTLFIMMPVLSEMYTVAFEPFQSGDVTFTEALDAAVVPLKAFMLGETEDKSLSLFIELSETEIPEEGLTDEQLVDLPLTVVAPAFVVSEITQAFKMGFYVFLPFLVIDLVVASILMSMGMVMLPPAMISLPFKILMFVMVDGWHLVIETLMKSFMR
ncbi:flagellar type III secretion system pore protein FliP [Ruminococcaceae bacterium OttesenSCG-928-A11]|nr:flagellar type III secretion system pore protein FliP [Ruminococcaceae bacterium OttesenSCG-928-A11]